VKHILPSSNEIVDLKNENEDKATADWLNQQYTSGNTGGGAAVLGDVMLQFTWSRSVRSSWCH